MRIFLIVGLVWLSHESGLFDQFRESEKPETPRVEKARIIPDGFRHGSGTVYKILPDDTKGTSHQRFLIREATDGSSLLIVHNIDLAPRIKNIKNGDIVEYCGEFVDNDRGGLIHWTHHDPAKSGISVGWLRHEGAYYE